MKTGAPWRWMPNDLPPWAAVYQQTQRWLAAGRTAEPSAAIIVAGLHVVAFACIMMKQAAAISVGS